MAIYMEYYSIREAARKMGCSFQWVQRLVEQGRIKQAWVPTEVWRIPASEVDRFMAERETKKTAKKSPAQ